VSLKEITVTPIAFESLGVRSMCTFIETPDVKLLIDPGLSLGPRFGLMPHPSEYKARAERRMEIARRAQIADLLVITHWHYDHYTPTFHDEIWNGSSLEAAEEIFKDKIVYAKDIKGNINPSQRRRGWLFKKTAGRFIKRMEYADGNSTAFGKTRIEFSGPVFHGEKDTALGWVVMVTISRDDASIMFASDVQGPMIHDTVKMILEEKPKVLIIGGPPTYLRDYKVSESTLRTALSNIGEMASGIPTIVLEHHILRDKGWREFAEPAFGNAKRHDNKILTAAEFLGGEEKLLEARREELYEKDLPSTEFLKWTKLSDARRENTSPPI
jgi:predicted metallo-beta-lactamase superfamily hydrolase